MNFLSCKAEVVSWQATLSWCLKTSIYGRCEKALLCTWTWICKVNHLFPVCVNSRFSPLSVVGSPTCNLHFDVKVGTHEGTCPYDYSLQLVPWRVDTWGLIAGTYPTNSSHEAFWGTSRRDLYQKLVWICVTSRTLVPATRFWSRTGQFTQWDLSSRLVTGTSPFVCTDLK